MFTSAARITTSRVAFAVHHGAQRSMPSNSWTKSMTIPFSSYGKNQQSTFRQMSRIANQGKKGRSNTNRPSNNNSNKETKSMFSSRIRPAARGRKRSKPCSSKQQRQKATMAGTVTSNPSHTRRLSQLLFPRYTKDSINTWLNTPRTLPIPRWISPRMITFQISECFGHASFILVAVSYAMDDFLHLRVVAIVGSTAMLVFTYFHPHGRVLWLPFRWNCVFVALNSWRVAIALLEHYRASTMSEELEAIYDHHFYVLEKTNFARLVRLGTLETYREGDIVLRQDEDNRCVRLVVSGDLAVDRDDQITYFLHEGQFLSEMGLHAGLGLRGSVASCCNVKAATSEVQLLRWDRTELMHLLDLHKPIERALKAVLSWDIVSKLKSQRVLLASGHIEDAELWTRKRREQSLARYKAILKNMLSHPDYLNARKDKLTKYREIHQVSDEDHADALQDIGWTLAEFEAGVKEGQLDEDALELEKLGFQWWFQSWWKAL